MGMKRDQRIFGRLARHKELMDAHQANGMDNITASKQAHTDLLAEEKARKRPRKVATA